LSQFFVADDDLLLIRNVINREVFIVLPPGATQGAGKSFMLTLEPVSGKRGSQAQRVFPAHFVLPFFLIRIARGTDGSDTSCFSPTALLIVCSDGCATMLLLLSATHLLQVINPAFMALNLFKAERCNSMARSRQDGCVRYFAYSSKNLLNSRAARATFRASSAAFCNASFSLTLLAFLLPALSVSGTPLGVRKSRHESDPSFQPVKSDAVSLCSPNLPLVHQFQYRDAEVIVVDLCRRADLIPGAYSLLQLIENFLLAHCNDWCLLGFRH
jgi:hypothetical protein